jgi:hypothetical protein
MNRSRYDEYVRRFNASDSTAFDDFYQPHVRMKNGMVLVDGLQAMKDNYAKVWAAFKDTLHVERFVGDATTLAVQMYTTFLALGEFRETPFGPVSEGDLLEYRGLILYDVEEEKFAEIVVAYQDFTFTRVDGSTDELGIPR